MNSTPTINAESNDRCCQHCGEPVAWSSRPNDAKFGATVHADNNTACPVQS